MRQFSSYGYNLPNNRIADFLRRSASAEVTAQHAIGKDRLHRTLDPDGVLLAPQRVTQQHGETEHGRDRIGLALPGNCLLYTSDAADE